MADIEIIVDISKNFLKERDIEINSTVDKTNCVDMDVVM